MRRRPVLVALRHSLVARCCGRHGSPRLNSILWAPRSFQPGLHAKTEHPDSRSEISPTYLEGVMATIIQYDASNSHGRLHKLWHRVTGYKFINRKNHGQEWRARASMAWEARLPARRSTDETRRTTNFDSNVNPQLGSLFFCKLPLELRRQIYVDILGYDDFFFHVTNENTSLNGNELGKEQIPFDFRCHGGQGLLSFLMSCKSA